MKSNMNTKILRLAVVEILSQSGFDKTADQALNVLTDILRYYIEHLGCRMRRKGENGIVPELICRFLVDEEYGECEYQIPELLSFLRYQVTVKNYLNDRYSVGSEESILHILRVLPKNAQLRMVMRNGGNLNDMNEVEKEVVEEDVRLDEFTKEFVESSLQKAGKREVREYRLESVDLIDGEPARRVKIGDGEFNAILDQKQNGIDFLEEPGVLVRDFAIWNNRHVFKGYE